MARPTRSSVSNVRTSAAEQLEQSIAADIEAERSNPEDEISVEEARAERPLVSYDDKRQRARVLFVTNDTSFLNPVDEGLDRFFELIGEFDEIHIMVLRTGVLPTKPVLRVRERVWVYIASSKHWWWTPVIANEEMAINQLKFANGFRPDLIVALEPFESGLAAQWIGKAQNRPVQIHVRRNFRSKSWRKESPRNKWRSLLARYVLSRATSVRVQTKQIRDSIQSWCSSDSNLSLLPRFNNFTSIIQHTPEFDLHTKYPMYEKILLYVGALNYDSTLFNAIDVLKYILANPRVGLVVIGDGPTRADCERKIKKLGLETQVVFSKEVTDVATYLKTADALFLSDTTVVSDELSLQAAIATLPTIMLETELRREYFTDTQNAYICPKDFNCFKEKLMSLIHESGVAADFRKQLAHTVRPRLAEDAQAYHQRYRESVERMVVDGVSSDQQ